MASRISARVITDSVNPCGNRLTTFVATFPRYILSEVNTHRALSRNSASSRAIPTKKMLRAVMGDPVMPVNYGKNGSGMQAKGELTGWRRTLARAAWRAFRWPAVLGSLSLHLLGVHKQLANRLLEPWLWTTAVISGTEWGNFFNLRCSPHAQPEFQCLAYEMLTAYVGSTPRRLKAGEWHLPFGDRYLAEGLTPDSYLKISTARCARVSYLNFDGEIDHAKDYALHDRLLVDGHVSPAEHQGRAEDGPVRSGNFVGFTQYRKLIPGENRSTFDPYALLAQERGYEL